MAKTQTSEAKQTPKETQTKADKKQPTTLPAKGNGPLSGYPYIVGATHFRIHTVDGQGRIEDAIVLDSDADGGAITRAPLALLGDARWWDVMPESGVVRCVFVVCDGDRVKRRLGLGPIMTTKRRTEGSVKEGTPTSDEPEAKSKAAAVNDPGALLFGVMEDMRERARREAQKDANMVLSLGLKMFESTTAQNRDFFEAMTRLTLGARSDERKDKLKSEAHSAKAIESRVLAKLTEALAEEDEDDDEDDDKPAGTMTDADLVAKLIEVAKGLGDEAKPFLSALGRKLASSAVDKVTS